MSTERKQKRYLTERQRVQLYDYLRANRERWKGERMTCHDYESDVAQALGFEVSLKQIHAAVEALQLPKLRVARVMSGRDYSSGDRTRAIARCLADLMRELQYEVPEPVKRIVRGEKPYPETSENGKG